MRFLIIILLTLSVFHAKPVFSQTYSDITYNSGTSIDVGTGADVCATNIIVNGSFSGGGTICSGPLPVSLLSFNAYILKNNVSLNWQTSAELNNSGFDVERKKEAGQWQKIAFVTGGGTTNEPRSYNYADNKLQSGSYNYRLKQIDYNGSHEYFDLTSDVIVELPKNFTIGQNYPNPSNPRSKIDYEIPIHGLVTLRIYNLIGQEVITLVNETKEAGYYTAEFDGSNLSSGVYFYMLNSSDLTQVKKLILIK